MDNKLFTDLTTGSFIQRLFAYMNAVGLQTIHVEYSGGGDSGGVDHVSFHPAIKDHIVEGIRTSFEEDLAAPIYDRHGSFADGGGYYVNGEVIYNAAQRTVYISGTDHNTEYSNYDEETGESDEETSEEEWEECVYSETPRKKIQGSDEEADCAFAYLYARDFLGGKLPEEFHNKMLIEASLDKDEHATNYVKGIK